MKKKIVEKETYLCFENSGSSLNNIVTLLPIRDH